MAPSWRLDSYANDLVSQQKFAWQELQLLKLIRVNMRHGIKSIAMIRNST